MGADVFISYHEKSGLPLVKEISEKLGKFGITTWYFTDYSHGGYSGKIVKAINSCRVFLMLVDREGSYSEHILNEIDIAFNRRNNGNIIDIVPYVLSDEPLSDDLIYYINRFDCVYASKRPLNDLINKVLMFFGSSPVSPDEVAAHSCELLPQRICRSDTDANICMNTERDQFEKFANENRFIMLTGPGGVGKSTFLFSLNGVFSNGSGSYVSTISLQRLLDYSEKNFISRSEHCESLRTANMYNSYISRSVGVDLFKRETGYVFILDGLNEFIASSTKTDSNTVSAQIMKELDMIAKAAVSREYDMTVIITTRSDDDVKYFKTAPTLIQLMPLDSVTVTSDDFSAPVTQNDLDSIKQLLSLPLYFNMFVKMKAQGRKFESADKYRMLLEFHRTAYAQASGKYDPNIYMWQMMYFVIVPLIAKHFEDIRAFSASENEISSMLADEMNASGFYERAVSFINYGVKSPIPVSSIPKLSASYYCALLGSIEFIKYRKTNDTVTVEFSHQEWREYFASFYTCAMLDINEYTNFNITTTVQELVADGAGLRLDSADFPENFIRVFAHTDITPCRSEKEQLKQLERNIISLYVCYEYFDQFMIHKAALRAEIAQPFFDDLLENLDVMEPFLRRLSSETKNMLSFICSGMIQYYRLMNDYARCREYYLLAYKYADEYSTVFAKRILKNQMAKALIFNAQSIYYDDAKSNWDDSLPSDELFERGIRLLRENCYCNMSANNYGAIRSTPVRWLLERGEHRDEREAVRVYDACLSKMTKGRLIQLGTERIYLVRQYIGLFLKGCVKVENGEVVPNERIERPSKETLDFVENLFSNVEFQTDSAKLIEIYRGLYLIFRNEDDCESRANMFFEKADKVERDGMHYLSNIARAAAFGEDGCKRLGIDIEKACEHIRSKFTFFAGRIGGQRNCDNPDFYYLLKDGLNLIRLLSDSPIKAEYAELADLIDKTNPTADEETVQLIRNKCRELPLLCEG